MHYMKSILKATMIISFLLTATCGHAQDKFSVELQKHSLTANFLSPGLQYEAKLSDNKSVVVSGGLSATAGWSGFNGFITTVRPFLSTEYRSYYSRKTQKKSLQSNSGNYIGGILGYQFNELTGEYRSTFNNRLMGGAVWGIQRRYQSNLQLGVQAGLVMTYDDYFGIGGNAMARVQLGWIIR